MTSLVVQSRTEIEALCRRYSVRRLEHFGSAATGQDRPGESTDSGQATAAIPTA